MWSLVFTLPSLLVFSLSDPMAFLEQTPAQPTVHALLSGKIPGGVNSPVETMKIGVQISAGAFRNPEGFF